MIENVKELREKLPNLSHKVMDIKWLYNSGIIIDLMYDESIKSGSYINLDNQIYFISDVKIVTTLSGSKRMELRLRGDELTFDLFKRRS